MEDERGKMKSKFKKHCVKVLSFTLACAMALMVLPVEIIASAAEGTDETTSHSLRVGTVEPELALSTSRYAQAQKTIQVTADEYVISFDYCAGNVLETSYVIFQGFAGGNAVAPKLQRRGSQLRLYEGSSMLAGYDGVFSASGWVHFDVYVKNGKMSFYKDGVPLSVSGKTYEYQMAEGTKIDQIGWFGDTSSGWYDAWGYYDNFAVADGGVLTYFDSFDEGENTDTLAADKGWSFGRSSEAGQDEDAFGLDGENCEPGELDSVELAMEQDSFVVNEVRLARELFSASAVLTSGDSALSAALGITVQSSDESVVRVDDGGYLHFEGSGTCDLEATVSYLSSTYTETFSVTVLAGNSISLGGGESGGYAERSLSGAGTLGDDFYLVYDYLYEAGNDASQSIVFQLQDQSGALTGPKVYNDADYLYIAQEGAEIKSLACDFSTWHKITAHISGQEFALYIDGELWEDSTGYTVDRSGIMSAFGAVGIEVASDSMAYLDNFTVVQDGEVLVYDDMDDQTAALEDLGWTLYGQTGYADPISNAPVLKLDSLSAAEKYVFFNPETQVSLEDAFDIRLLLKGGSELPMGVADISIESSDDSVVAVETDEGIQTLSFKKEGSASMTVSASYLGQEQSATVPVKVSAGGSVQTGTPTSVYGEMWRVLADDEMPSSDDYYISFDYMPQQATYLYIWQGADKNGKAVGLTMQQINNDLQINISGYPKLMGVLTYNKWHNITMHIHGLEVELYLDGIRQKIGSSDTYTMAAGTGRLAKIGPVGDTSSSGNNKNAIYDNISIMESNAVVFCENFNSGKSLADLGWVAKGETAYTNPLKNQPVGTLDSISLTTVNTLFSASAGEVALSDVFELTATLSNGEALVPQMGKTTITSSAAQVVQAEEKDGGYVLNIGQEGTAVLSVTLDYLGVSRTRQLILYVGGGSSGSQIGIGNASTTLSVGDSTQLQFVRQYTNGATSVISADSIADLTVTSSDTGVLQIEKNNGIYYLKPVSAGMAKVAVSYTEDGAAKAIEKWFHVRGGALQTGDGRGNTNGQARRVLKGTSEEILSADEYFISFDYMYPEWATMYNYYTWYHYDTQYIVPAILQTNQTLSMYCGTNAPIILTETLEPDVWHNITFHFKDGYIAAYLDGKQIRLTSSNYWLKRPDNTIIPALGWFGDTTSNDVSTGDAYYDNIMVVQVPEEGKTITTLCDFNDASSWSTGWSMSGPAITRNASVMDSPFMTLDSIAVSGRTGYKPGQEYDLEEVLSVTGTLTNGKAAVMALGDISYESSDENCVEITEKDGKQVLKAGAEGRCTITVTCKLFDVEKTASIDILVTEEDTVNQISLQLERSFMVAGETVEPLFASQTTDGNSGKGYYESYPGLTVTSLNPDIITVEENNGKLTLKALKKGTAVIRLSYEVLGKTQTSDFTVSVSAIESLTASLAKTPFYQTDTNDVVITAHLDNGISLTDIAFDSITYQNTFSDIIEVTDEGRLYAQGTGNNISIGVEAVLGGNVNTATFSADVLPLTPAKAKSSYYTAEKVENAKENIETYSWAKDTANNATAESDAFLASFDYEEMWSNITSQSLPRSYGVNQEHGGILCGKAIDAYGSYPYKIDYSKMEWKIYCPVCSVSTDFDDGKTLAFPTNDFKAYYEGGLNEYGEFDPALAKRYNDELIMAGQTGNLVNLYAVNKSLSAEQIQHLRDVDVSEDEINRILTDPNWGVDDGWGYVDEKTSIKYTFVAYYNHWYTWQDGPIKRALTDLSDAYMYTGEQKYADAAIVILDRMADLYKDMDLRDYKAQDGFINGVDGVGKTVNSVWETSSIAAAIKAYDAIFPGIDTMGEEAKEFLQSKSAVQDKTNPDRIKLNFEDNVLRVIIPAFKEGLIHGNEGMHQMTMALAAVVLDHYPETQDWLYTVFRTGGSREAGNFYKILVDQVSHDGQGDESSPFYNAGWLSNWLGVAQVLDGYELPEGKPLEDNLESDPFKNVKFKKMFYGIYPMIVNSIYTATVGDSAHAAQPDISMVNKNELIIAFEKYGDIELAQLVHMLNGYTIAGIHSDIFTKDPEAVAGKIEKIIDEHGYLNLESEQLSGNAFSVLRDGTSVKPDAAYSYNFMDMDIVEGGALVTQNYPPTVQFNATKRGDTIAFSFDFDGDTSKAYNMNIAKWTTGFWGIYQVSLNGELVQPDMSFVGTGEIYETLKNIHLASGTNTLKFVCNVDSNFKMGVRTMGITESADEETEKPFKSNQRDVWTTYDKDGNHDHKDALSIGINAYMLDLSPDLGYPLRADSGNERMHWVSGTLSHDTVLVDSKQQTNTYAGEPKHFDDSGFVKLMDTEATRNYSTTDLYKRTVSMIQIDEDSSYIVDLFRVSGGSTHEYSFHGGESANTTVDGLTLEAKSGTYAGTGTQFGVMPNGDVSSGNPGYYWLYDVKAQNGPTSGFSIDWAIKDTYNVYGNGAHADTNIHLKLTMLGDYDTVSMAKGNPPSHAGAASYYDYVIAKRTGKNLDSTFTAVIEPYYDDSKILKIEEAGVTFNGAQVDDMEARAVKVTLKNGRIDYIVCALDTAKQYRVADLFDFCGFYGVYSIVNGELSKAYINDGSQIDTYEAESELTGKVIDFTKTLSVENEITVSLDQTDADVSNLAGRYVYIANDRVKNAVYKIVDAEKTDGNNVRLNIGDVTPVRSWTDSYDFSNGFAYDFAAGASLVIPLSDLFETETPPQTYSLQVEAGTGGSVSSGSNGNYGEGTRVSISAVAQAGYQFEKWVAGSGSFDNAYSAQTTFTMPAGNVKITAQFKAVSDNGNQYDDTPSGTSSETTSSSPGSITVSGNYGSDKENKTIVSKSDVNQAVRSAVEAGKQNGTAPKVEIVIKGTENVEKSQVSLPVSSLKKAGKDGIQSFSLVTVIASIAFDNDALKGLAGKATDSSLRISAVKVDVGTLSDDVKAKVGNASVFEFTIMDGTKVISGFGGGKATITVPYTLKSGESADGIVVWHIGSGGSLTKVENVKYDADSKTVTFETTHFSAYAITYVAPESGSASSTASGSSSEAIPATGEPVLFPFMYMALGGMALLIAEVRRKKSRG